MNANEFISRPHVRGADPYIVEDGVLVEPQVEGKHDTRCARFERDYNPNLPGREHPDLRCSSRTAEELGIDTTVHIRYATPKEQLA